MWRIPFLSIVCFMSMLLLAPALATASDSPVAEYFRKQQAKQATIAADLRSSIESQNGEASLVEHEAYCRAVGWVIYQGFNGYSTQFGRLPESLEDLLSSGWLEEIPQNLLANREIRLLQLADGISEGDAVLEVCPPEFYSLTGSLDNYHLIPMSFQVGIYGPLPSPETAQKAVPSNTWARKPLGLATYLGTNTESASQSLEKMRERLAQLTSEEANDA